MTPKYKLLGSEHYNESQKRLGIYKGRGERKSASLMKLLQVCHLNILLDFFNQLGSDIVDVKIRVIKLA